MPMRSCGTGTKSAKDAPQYDVKQAGVIFYATTEMKEWRKLDDYTLN
jgi:hypothetical protein